MLGQRSEIDFPSPSLEEMQQKRLAYGKSLQQQESMTFASQDKSFQLLASDRNSESETTLKNKVNNRSNSNKDKSFSQDKHSVPLVELHNDLQFSSKISERFKLSENVFDKSNQVGDVCKPNGHAPLKIQIDDMLEELLSDQSDCNALASSTHCRKKKAENYGTDIEGEVYKSGSQGTEETLQWIFSDKSKEDIRSALGEHGLRSIMRKTARDLQQLPKGRNASQHVTELIKTRKDTASEVKTKDDVSSRSSSADSSDKRNRVHPKQQSYSNKGHSSSNGIKQNSNKQPSSKNSHKITSTVTKNFQQLKEEELDMNALLRNYNQVTVSSNSTNVFTSDEIYMQAFGTHSHLQETHSQPQGTHSRPKNVGPLSYHLQCRQDSPVSLDEASSFSRQFSFDNHDSMSPSILPQICHTYPLPMHISPTIESSFNSPISGLPKWSVRPQNGTDSFNICYPTSNNQFPLQYYQNMHYATCLPANPATSLQQNVLQQNVLQQNVLQQNVLQQNVLQQNVSTFDGSIAQCSETYGAPGLPHGIPFHITEPYMPQSYDILQQLQPHSPSPPRKDVSQLAISISQVTSDPLSDSGHVQIPHPPDAAPAPYSSDMPNKSLKHRRLHHTTDSYPHSQLQNVSQFNSQLLLQSQFQLQSQPHFQPQEHQLQPQLNSHLQMQPQLEHQLQPQLNSHLQTQPQLQLQPQPESSQLLPQSESHPQSQHELQLQSGESINIKVLRYLLSLPMHSQETSDASSDLSFSSSQSADDDFFDSLDIVESANSDIAGQTAIQAGLTRGLDVDSDEATKKDVASAIADLPAWRCQECRRMNSANRSGCTRCGMLLIDNKPTFLKKYSLPDSSEKWNTKRYERFIRRMKFLHKKMHLIKSSVENTECLDSECLCNTSPAESGKGLSPVGFIEESYLEGVYILDPYDSGSESITKLKEEDDIQVQNDAINVQEDSNISADDEEEGCINEKNKKSFKCAQNPVLKEFLLYKRQQLLNKYGSLFDDGNKFNMSAVHSKVCDVSTEQTNPNFPSAFECTSGSNQESGILPHYQGPLPKASPLPSLENEDDVRNSGVLLSNIKYQEKKVSKANVGVSSDQQVDVKGNVETDNEQLDLKINDAPTERFKMKKSRGRSMDMEICDYMETLKSHSWIKYQNIVPALKLMCSSDEEEAGDSEEKVYDAEKVDEGVDTDSDEVTMYNTFGSNQNSSAPSTAKTHIKHMSKVDQQSASTSLTAAQHAAVNTRQASPPNPAAANLTSPFIIEIQPINTDIGHGQVLSGVHTSLVYGKPDPAKITHLFKMCLHGKEDALQRCNMTARVQEVNQKLLVQVTVQEQRSGQGQLLQKEGRVRQSAFESYQRPSTAKVHSSSYAQRVQPPAVPRRGGFSKVVNRQTTSPSGPRDTHMAFVKSSPVSARATKMQVDSSLVAAEASLVHENVNCRESSFDNDSPRLLCSKLHRLPLEESGEVYTDHLHAVAKSAYDKLQEMTPRILKGQLSQWQCLPDEIWLYTFNFLSHCDLKNLMMASRYFNRLANDQTLWRYITVKPKYSMTDISLATIAHHQPLSLAMVKCQGNNLSLDGLKYFFKETQGRLKELNICGCSQGSLMGSVVMSVASQFCQQLTHIDASFCHLSDEAFVAMSNCTETLESVCLNGFQSMKDASLLILLKKHGQSLRTLELYACFSLTASAFHTIGEQCTNLRRLCLGSCNKLTDSAVIDLSVNLGQIEEFDLRGVKNLTNDCIQKIVRNCPCIRTLVLANCNQISNSALTEIATYLKTTLRSLDVCGCNSVSDNGVINLAKNCDRLTSLDISSTRCTNVSVQQLASSSCSQWLETVRLSFLSGLTETCMVNLIHHCPRLRSIHVFGCSSLRNLNRLKAANPKLSVEGDFEVGKSLIT